MSVVSLNDCVLMLSHRTLRIETDPSHTEEDPDLNMLLWGFPNLVKLVLDWRVSLHDTENSLLVPEEIFEDPPVKELEINIGTQSSDLILPGHDIDQRKLLSGIAAETGHIPENEVDWEVLADAFKLDRWGSTLKQLEVVVGFELGDQPVEEVSAVSRFCFYRGDVAGADPRFQGLGLLRDLLVKVADYAISDVRTTVNFFFSPKDFRLGTITNAGQPSRLFHRTMGILDVDSLVDEDVLRQTAQICAQSSTFQKLDVCVTGSTSNGWEHQERTLASA
jgi:hypothetical protein